MHVVAHKELLELVACGCKSVPLCSRANCSCWSANVSCNSYCKCEAKKHCANVHGAYTENWIYTVETDEEEELDEPLEEEQSEDVLFEVLLNSLPNLTFYNIEWPYMW